MSGATWIEVSARTGSREALVRCAIDLLAARGVEVVRAGVIEAVHELPPPGVLGASAPAGAAAPKSLASLAQGAVRPGSPDADVIGQARPAAIGPVQEAGSNTRSGGIVRSLLEVRGAGAAVAIDEVRAALEGRVQIAAALGTPAATGEEAGAALGPPAATGEEAGSVAAVLAGFVTEGIDHTADEAFAVTARDRADLLAAAAEALGALSVGPGSVRPIEVRAVEVRAPEESWADDDRLFAWLCEVLYALDVGRMALRRAVVLEDDERGVRGALFGEPIDEERHEVHGALKAVTYHGLAIEAVPEGVRTQVVIDV